MTDALTTKYSTEWRKRPRVEVRPPRRNSACSDQLGSIKLPQGSNAFSARERRTPYYSQHFAVNCRNLSGKITFRIYGNPDPSEQLRASQVEV